MAKDFMLRVRLSEEEHARLIELCEGRSMSEAVVSLIMGVSQSNFDRAIQTSTSKKAVEPPKKRQTEDIFSKPSKNLSSKSVGARARVHKYPDGYDPVFGWSDPVWNEK